MHSTPLTFSKTGVRGFRAIAVALLSLALAAGALVATPASAAVVSTGRISGVVTSAATGEPLAGISVTLMNAFDPLTDDDWISDDYTDAAGQYSFTRVPEGNYRIFFEDYNEDWDPETGEPIQTDEDVYLSQYYGGLPSDQTGDVPALSVGTTAITADQTLAIGGKYTGKVVTSDGKPAAGVNLYAITDGYDSFYGNQTVTSSNGRYTLSGVGYGTTTIYTAPTKTAPATLTVPTPLSAETPTATVPTIALSKGSFITGRLLTSAGKSAAHLSMFAEPVGTDPSLTDYFYDYVETDSKGRYRLGPLLPGTYAPKVIDDRSESSVAQYLGGSTDVFLARTVKISKPGVTISREFRMAKRATVTGTVRTASGGLAKNLPVVVLQADGTGTLLDDNSSSGFTETNSKGKYSISGLNPGSYVTGFGDRATASGAPVSKDIALRAGTTTLDRRLGAVTTVTGVVTSSAGVPLKGVTVSAIPVDETDCAVGSYYSYDEEPEISTSATGAYTIPLAAGDWVLRFTDSTERTSTAYLGGGTYLSDAATTVLTTSGSATIAGQDVVLSTSGADVSAYVHTSSGADEIEGNVSVERLVDGKVVDSDGVYSCTGFFGGYNDEFDVNEEFPLHKLADGDYRVTIEPMTFYNGYTVLATVIEFTVAGGILTTVDGEPAADPASLGDIELTAPVPSTEPEEREKPTIFAPDGATVGATLTAVTDYPGVDPDWSEYRWLRDGRPIAGAASENYVVQRGDIGAVLTFQFSGVSGTDYIDPITSTPSAVVTDAEIAVPEDAPSITGSGRVGETLTAKPAAGDPTGTTYGYQWSINGRDLLAVTGTTFTPRIQDLDETITVTVTKTLPGAEVSTGATSAGVTIGLGKAISLSKPKLLVNGNSKKKLRLGTTLSASIKGLPTDSAEVSYQWQLNRGSGWKSISGATSSSYALSTKKTSTSGVGYRYRLIVSVERSGYESGKPVTSSPRTASRASRG